jgi:hypothetical protein
MLVLQAFHPLVSSSPYLDSLVDFQLNEDLKLSLDFLRLAFLHMSYLFARGPFGMVFEHLWDAFDFKDFATSFL